MPRSMTEILAYAKYCIWSYPCLYQQSTKLIPHQHMCWYQIVLPSGMITMHEDLDTECAYPGVT